MTSSRKAIPMMRRVFLTQTNATGYPYTLAFEACPGETPEEAIDYALELVGELAEGWKIVSGYTALEKYVTEKLTIRPKRQAAFERESQ